VTAAVLRHGSVRHDVPIRAMITSIPITELLARLEPPPPADVLRSSSRLKYRDFLTVCLIVDQAELFPDNWIYIHEPGVKVARIQNFKNWSPAMVPDSSKTSLGLEYFCKEGDALWSLPDADLVALAGRELEQIGLVSAARVTDGCVIRMPKAYPVYDSTYAADLAVVREWCDRLENLQTVGRNGLHRYNNQDHSMLTGLYAARRLLFGETHDLWSINAEQDYHEEQVGEPDRASAGAPSTQRIRAAE
jgi:protoporphyrinogen oxidase